MTPTLLTKFFVFIGAFLATSLLWAQENPPSLSPRVQEALLHAREGMYVGTTKTDYLKFILKEKTLTAQDREALLNAMITEEKPENVSASLFNAVIAIDKQFKYAQRRKGMETLFNATVDSMTLMEVYFMMSNAQVYSLRARFEKKYYETHLQALSVDQALTLAKDFSLASLQSNISLNHAIEQYFNANLSHLSKADVEKLTGALAQPVLPVPTLLHQLTADIPLDFLAGSGKNVRKRILGKWALQQSGTQ